MEEDLGQTMQIVNAGSSEAGGLFCISSVTVQCDVTPPPYLLVQ